jgi:succinyl-diaminopimelate desuccinylase
VPSEPFLTTPAELVRAVEAAIEARVRRKPRLSTDGGTSDGRFIRTICPQIVELGVVNQSIHKIDEHVALDALEQLPLIYLEILRRLLG